MVSLVPIIGSMSVDADPSFNFTATSGSGTADDPYSGYLTASSDGPMYMFSTIPDTIYVEIGTTVDLWVLDNSPQYPSLVGDVGFGTSYSGLNSQKFLVGMADTVGTCELWLEYDQVLGRPGTLLTTFVVVESIADLVFESSPSEGTIHFIGS